MMIVSETVLLYLSQHIWMNWRCDEVGTDSCKKWTLIVSGNRLSQRMNLLMYGFTFRGAERGYGIGYT